MNWMAEIYWQTWQYPFLAMLRGWIWWPNFSPRWVCLSRSHGIREAQPADLIKHEFRFLACGGGRLPTHRPTNREHTHVWLTQSRRFDARTLTSARAPPTNQVCSQFAHFARTHWARHSFTPTLPPPPAHKSCMSSSIYWARISYEVRPDFVHLSPGYVAPLSLIV